MFLLLLDLFDCVYYLSELCALTAIVLYYVIQSSIIMNGARFTASSPCMMLPIRQIYQEQQQRREQSKKSFVAPIRPRDSIGIGTYFCAQNYLNLRIFFHFLFVTDTHTSWSSPCARAIHNFPCELITPLLTQEVCRMQNHSEMRQMILVYYLTHSTHAWADQDSIFLHLVLIVIDTIKSPNPKSTHANRETETIFVPLKKDPRNFICLGEPMESTGPNF